MLSCSTMLPTVPSPPRSPAVPCPSHHCLEAERRGNCSLWARSGARPLCRALPLTTEFRNSTFCGLALQAHALVIDTDSSLPRLPPRNASTLCLLNEELPTLYTNAELQRAEHGRVRAIARESVS